MIELVVGLILLPLVMGAGWLMGRTIDAQRQKLLPKPEESLEEFASRPTLDEEAFQAFYQPLLKRLKGSCLEGEPSSRNNSVRISEIIIFCEQLYARGYRFTGGQTHDISGLLDKWWSPASVSDWKNKAEKALRQKDCLKADTMDLVDNLILGDYPKEPATIPLDGEPVAGKNAGLIKPIKKLKRLKASSK